MKKKSIKRFGVVLLIIGLTAFVGWKIFNKKSQVDNPIPNYAEAIVCLDYVNIRNTLLSNYLFESDDINSTFLQEFRKSGLKIPNYIIAFSHSFQGSKGVFTSFEIENSTLFTTYIDSLVENLGYKIGENSTTIYSSDNGRIKFSFDQEKSLVVVATGINIHPEFVTKVFDDVFNKTNLLDEGDKILEEFKNNPHHGLVWFGKGNRVEIESWLTINMEKSKVVLDGSVFLKEEYWFEEENSTISGRKSQARLYLNGGNSLFIKELYNNIDRDKFKKLTNFSLDSLIRYSNRTFDFSLYGTETLSDTSVKYEYDDNFNKVEKIEISESIHPQFELLIPYKNNSLFNYLIADSCIKQVDEKYVFTPYPFSTIHASSGEGLSLFTSPNLSAPAVISPSAIEFHADFTELDTNLLDQIGIRNSMLINKTYSLRVFQKSDSTKVEGSIEFK